MHFDSLICWSDATAPGVVCHVDRPISPAMVRTVEVAAYPRGIKMDRTSGHRAIKAKQHPTYLLAYLTYLDPAEPTWRAGVPGLGRAIVLLESTALSSCALGRLRVARGCACGRPVGDAGSPNRRPRARLNGAEGPCLGLGGWPLRPGVLGVLGSCLGPCGWRSIRSTGRTSTRRFDGVDGPLGRHRRGPRVVRTAYTAVGNQGRQSYYVVCSSTFV